MLYRTIVKYGCVDSFFRYCNAGAMLIAQMQKQAQACMLAPVKYIRCAVYL